MKLTLHGGLSTVGSIFLNFLRLRHPSIAKHPNPNPPHQCKCGQALCPNRQLHLYSPLPPQRSSPLLHHQPRVRSVLLQPEVLPDQVSPWLAHIALTSLFTCSLLMSLNCLFLTVPYDGDFILAHMARIFTDKCRVVIFLKILHIDVFGVVRHCRDLPYLISSWGQDV